MSQYAALVASFPGLQPQLMPGNEATAQVKRIHYKWARPLPCPPRAFRDRSRCDSSTLVEWLNLPCQSKSLLMCKLNTVILLR